MTEVKKNNDVTGIVDFVKQEIIFGRMRPRERLIEEDLTEQFGCVAPRRARGDG